MGSKATAVNRKTQRLRIETLVGQKSSKHYWVPLKLQLQILKLQLQIIDDNGTKTFQYPENPDILQPVACLVAGSRSSKLSKLDNGCHSSPLSRQFTSMPEVNSSGRAGKALQQLEQGRISMSIWRDAILCRSVCELLGCSMRRSPFPAMLSRVCGRGQDCYLHGSFVKSWPKPMEVHSLSVCRLVSFSSSSCSEYAFSINMHIIAL